MQDTGNTPSRKTRIEQAEARTEQAKSRSEQAETRTDQAETRTEQAETRTEQAQTRAEQAETRAEQAETRTEQAETRTEQVEAALLQAVQRAESPRNQFVTRSITNLSGQAIPGPALPVDQLTGRQREILQLIAEGQNTKQIGDILKVSPKTVEYHRMKLMEGLNLHDVPGLVRYALRVGLIAPY